MTEAAASFVARVDLVCFEAAGRTYAVEVSEVREIVRMLEIVPLPNAPALIEGVVDLRGVPLPVIDLGRALGGEPVALGGEARIAVLDVGGMLLGLRVEAATGVLALEGSALEDPPSLVTQAGYQAVRAVVNRADAGPVMVLSTADLVASVQRSAAFHAGRGD